MSSEEKVEATSPPEEQPTSEEKPAAGEKEETKPDSTVGEASEQVAAASTKEGQEATEEEPDDEEPDDGVPIVLVTGASGFIATHLIKQLLEQGRYRIRGTVRSKKRQEKVWNVRYAFMTCVNVWGWLLLNYRFNHY